MDLGENESVTSCELWIDEHNSTYQNWSSDIETEYLDLCVGPQRFYNPQQNIILFAVLLQASWSGSLSLDSSLYPHGYDWHSREHHGAGCHIQVGD